MSFSAGQFLFGGSLPAANGGQLFQDTLAEPHEIAGQNLIEGGPVCGVGLEDAHDERHGLIWNSHRLGDHIVAFSDLLICGIGIFSFEGRYTEIEGVENNPQTPDIHFEVIALAFENFRSNIIGSPTHRALALFFKLQLGGQSEVSNFDVELPIDEDVAEL